MNRYPMYQMKAILIDLDDIALDQAKSHADSLGLGDRFSYIKGGPNKLAAVCKDCKPDLIEMIGFLDYRPRDKAITLIKRIYDSRPKGGLFLTGNIRNNPEKPFLDWLLL